MSLLQVESVRAGYGNIPVLFDVSLRIEHGETLALLGRNGMGKTTLLRTIMGMTQIYQGEILVDGQAMTGKPTRHIAKHGVRFVPDDRGIFSTLTVAGNLRLGSLAGRDNRKIVDALFEHFPILKLRLHQPASVLSGGERQILSIARALLSDPRLLLIDEFSEGLQPSIVQGLFRILQEFRDRQTSILLVDQDARFALSVSQRVYLMEKGHIVDQGASKEFRADEERLHARLIL